MRRWRNQTRAKRNRLGILKLYIGIPSHLDTIGAVVLGLILYIYSTTHLLGTDHFSYSFCICCWDLNDRIQMVQ